MDNNHETMGVDVSKSTLDVALFPSAQKKQFPNDPKGISQLLLWTRKMQPAMVIFEPTGGYEKSLQRALLDEGISCSKVNARQIRDFARCTGRIAKTDSIDSSVIAQFGAVILPQPMVARQKEDQLLAELIKRRRQLVNELAREKNRLEKTPHPDLQRSIKRHIGFLDKEIAAFDKSIQVAIGKSDELAAKSKILRSVDGVGSNTAAILIAEMPELGRIGSRPIASLAGLAPHNCDSGSMRGKRMISGGRVAVRCALYMATLAAIRKDGSIRRFYQHLKNNGKPSKLALTAAMRKLLIQLNAKLRDEFYQPTATPEKSKTQYPYDPPAGES